MQEGKYKL